MYQQITLVGNLGRAPEMRYLPDGTAVTSFSVAVNRKYGNKDETAWFRVSVWGKQAEACNQYLDKGRQVLVVGRLQFDPATGASKIFTKQDGTSGTSFEVRADSVTFLGGGERGSEEFEERDSEPSTSNIPF